MGWISHQSIVSDPDIILGKPTTKGTRIMAELLEAYPHLTADDVRAALHFAADDMSYEDSLFGSPNAA